MNSESLSYVIQTLHFACALAEDSKIPGLHALVKGALKVAEMAKETYDLQDKCYMLAQRAAMYSAAVYGQLSSGMSALDEGTATKYIESLIETLAAIEGLMIRRKKARFVDAFLRRDMMAKEVKKLAGRLEDAVRVFDIQSSIYTNQQITTLLQRSQHLLQHAENVERVETALLSGNHRIDSTMQEILHCVRVDPTHDGAMRLYGRDEVELVEEIGVEDSGTEPGEEGRVVQYSARICESGKPVTVRLFQQPAKKFRDAIAIAKKIWHPNVVHAIGYSREDPDTSFIVNNGVYTHTYDTLSKSFHGIDKFLWTMQSSKQVIAGLMHLKSVFGDLDWSSEKYSIDSKKGLVVSPDGTILLDVSCYDLKLLPGAISHETGTIDLYDTARDRITKFSNHLEEDPEKRFTALFDLWCDLTSFDDPYRSHEILWRTLPLPCPGQCFSLSKKSILHGMKPELLHCSDYRYELGGPSVYLDQGEGQENVARIEVLDATESPSPSPRLVGKDVTQWTVDPMMISGGEIRDEYHKWTRYEVHNMALGWTFENVYTAANTRGATSDCQHWFRNHDLDFFHAVDNIDDLAIAYGFEFRTRSHLIPLAGWDENADFFVPPTLYFYERAHTRKSTCAFESPVIPWGFWSTDPNGLRYPLEIDGRSARRPELQGALRSGEFVWVQRFPTCAFIIKVRVDVLYNRFTPDECMVLNEMLRCATPEQRASVPRVATIKGGEHYRRLHESDSDEDEYDSEDYETDDGMDVDEETE